MAVVTYDPSLVDVIIDGQRISVESVSYEMDAPLWEPVVSRNSGDIARAKNSSQTAVLTVEVLQTSTENKLLSDLYNDDVLYNSGVVPASIKDGNGESSFSSPAAYVEGLPSVTYSNEVETRTWTLKCSRVTAKEEGVE